MAEKSDDFLKRLLATFKIEAKEHLREMSSLLLALENSPRADESQGHVETLFREAHSLKGAARAVNLSPIEAICQSLEDVLARLKNHRIIASAGLFDILHRVIDGLRETLAGSELQADFNGNRIADLNTLLKRAQANEVTTDRQSFPRETRPTKKEKQKNRVGTSLPRTPLALAESVRIATTKLDALLLQTEEMLSVKYAVGQHADELRTLVATLKAWEKEWTRAFSEVRRMQRALEKNSGRNGKSNDLKRQRPQTKKFVEVLERGDLLLKSFDNRLSLLATAVDCDHRVLSKMVDNLLEDTKKILMLPFASLLEVFPKLVRDLSRDRGKEADLWIEGEQIEIDKRILEEMKDPLIHLVRNGIDHGIENPAVRRRQGKPVRGKITIAIASKTDGKIDVLISDDGAGINVAKLRSAAVKYAILTQEEANQLSEPEMLTLVFRSGVSTSPIITDLSGRGLGLTIVREKVEKLGGAISVESRPNVGTSFHIVLPLTIATFHGLLVQVDERIFVLPITNVERVVRVKEEDIKTVENRETIQIHGQTLALVRLADVLELQNHVRGMEQVSNAVVVILSLGTERIAFRVDVVHGEQEVLVKRLGVPLLRVRNIAGATVLGTGQVAPIINVFDLMKSAVKIVATPAIVGEKIAPKKSILVVEDSITARTLVKNILEAAGYTVKTAVDGADAFTLLKTEKFDVVVSDVEMPRMNGFDLTAKIRANKNLWELPVVLVTALESREHRERGIDVGANAYLVKSSFDQSNLLGTIRQLI